MGQSAIAGWANGVLSALCFAAMGELVHHAPGSLGGVQILFWRGACGVLLITVPAVALRPRFKRRAAWDLVKLGAAGALAVLFYFLNLRRIDASLAATLHQAAPVFVVLLAPLLLREHSSRRAWGGTIAAFAGIALLSSPAGQALDAASMGLGLSGALFGGIAYVLLRSSSRHSTVAIVWAICASMVLIAIVRYDASWFRPSAAEAWFLLPIGVCSLGGQFFLARSYRTLPAVKASLLTYLGVVFTLLYDVAFGSVRLNPASLIALALIAGGLLLTHSER